MWRLQPVDLLFHGLNVSFDKFVQGKAEEVAEPEKALQVRVGPAVLPVGNALAGDENSVRQLLLGKAQPGPVPFDLSSKFHASASLASLW